MLISGYTIIICCTLIVVESERVVSEESKEVRILRREKNRYSVDEPERRHLDYIDDKEWHVAHLRDMDFGPRRSGCKEETFEEKAARYRKALRNDGALVKFVSADQLPVDKKDLEVDVCRIPEAVEVFKSRSKSGNVSEKHDKLKSADGIKKETVDTAKTSNDATANHQKGNIKEEIKKEKVDKAAINDGANGKRNKTTKEPKRRAGDYMFSSVEYYDEVEDFDISVCHANVEEIVLEIEHIKNYDVQCEMIIEWRSLE